MRHALRALVLWLSVTLAAGSLQAQEGSRTPSVARSSQLVLAVESAVEAGRELEALAKARGGRLISANEAAVVVEVPDDRYRDFSSEVRKLGELRSERVSSSDLSRALADARSAVQAARAAQDRRGRLGAVAQGVNDKLLVERVLEGTAARVVDAQARVRDLERRVGLCTVTVRLESAARESIEPAVLPFRWLDELGPGRLANPPSDVPGRSIELRALTDFALSLKTNYVHDAEPLDGTKLAMALAFDLRVLGEANPVGIFGGMNLALGASRGFVYGLQFMGGVGMPLGRRFAFGVASGPGIDGITSVVPFGLSFPVELWLGWDLVDFMYVSAWGQNGWVLFADERQSGADHALFGDELSAGLAVVLGDRGGDGTYTQRREGWLFGAGYRELMGTRMFELRIGYAGVHSDFSGGY